MRRVVVLTRRSSVNPHAVSAQTHFAFARLVVVGAKPKSTAVRFRGLVVDVIVEDQTQIPSFCSHEVMEI